MVTGVRGEEADDMAIDIDKDRCIGAGLCALTAPAVFTQDDDGLSELLPSGAGDHGAAQAQVRTQVQEAVRVCPVRAISLSPPG